MSQISPPESSEKSPLSGPKLGALDIETRRRRRWPWVTGAVVVVAAIVAAVVVVNAPHGPKPFGTNLTVQYGAGDKAGKALLEYIAKDVAPDYGVTITPNDSISDYNQANRVVSDGTVPALLFEHKPFLNDEIAANGFQLEAVTPVYTWNQASLSQKWKSWAQVPDGATIGLRSDPAGQAIALLDLAWSKQITLKPGHTTLAGLPQLKDIATNPKGYKFTQVNLGQLGRILPDVDVEIVHIEDVYLSGVYRPENVIDNPPAPKGSEAQLVVNPAHRNDPNVKKLIKVFEDPRIQTWLKTTDNPLVKSIFGPADSVG